jgi:hypothetical protein
MKLIKLTGKYAVGEFEFVMVDDEDYEELNKYNWNLTFATKNKKDGKIYEYTKPYPQIQSRMNYKLISMSRYIMKHPEGLVDHIDRNTLNNQKSNLRVVNKQNNSLNKKAVENTSSRFTGVYWDKKSEKWHVCVKKDRKTKHLGLFYSEIEAAEMRDLFMVKYFLGFARLNFPEKEEYYKEKLKNSYGYL